MKFKQIQDLKPKFNLNMTQDMRLAINLLSFNELELIHFIQKQAQKNILIDCTEVKDISDLINVRYFKETNLHKYSDIQNINFIESLGSHNNELKDYLWDQIYPLSLDTDSKEIISYLVDSLDNDGFLHESVWDVQSSLKKPLNKIKDTLTILQSLDPKGIASRNPIESLMSQTNNELLKILIRSHLNNVAEQNYEIICSDLSISKKHLSQLLNELKSLSPYPARGFDLSDLTMSIPMCM